MELIWDSMAARYQELITSRGSLHQRNQQLEALIGEAASHFPRHTPSGLAWFIDATKDAQRLWFVAAVLKKVRPMPRLLLDPVVTAALLVKDASAPQSLIGPCERTFGSRVVADRIKELSSTPGVKENDGVAKASYWLGRCR
jgi:hypothetical protein